MLDDDPLTRIGHTSLDDTGVTAVVAPHEAGMVAAVDVRGGGPGTRETDLLEPHNTVERVHAILLCGGSAFGLAAADGAMQELERRGWGFPVFGEGAPGPRVPIVPAAVIFDLVVGDPSHRPGPEDGARAVAAAFETPSSETGSVGAGCGATAGVLRGGFGRARVETDGYSVEANVVANPVGSVVDARTGLLFGDPDQPAVDLKRFTQLQRPTPKLNTTIGVIATDAPLTKAQLKRVAMTGHDGIARAVRPAHSPLDGDTLCAVSTAAPGEQPVTDVETLGRFGEAAAQAVQAAIVDAVVHATGAFGVSAWEDIAR
ncbi:P1 family peptidase [Corynebacterium lujinxingii]|uniref:P1 family peptidase n=1 Tax=Corynebacterium lujinxingii TaxID=2763010 RepID=A0A7H0JXU9_9CORY|nr:P1 family peptidase [Corynebacterium lujinxingii]MBC3179849.1 P1 family peptidase [Corynebacterium lujinxingii]NNO11710.1 peptidase S58 family protein [Corynebacterium lujinxingii]QNP89865.1 P1 family peptidase [Corynebacterium lujinxingii]